MTTRRVTQADLDGTSERGRAAYEARQDYLRRAGILPADQPERSTTIYDLPTPEEEQIIAMDEFDRELREIEIADRMANAELRRNGWPGH